MKSFEMILLFIFVVYLFGIVPLPQNVNTFIDTQLGNITVWISAFILVLFVNPFIGVIGVLVAYDLVTYSKRKFAYHSPAESEKYNAMASYNQFPYTLEQEVIKKMAPIRRSDVTFKKNYSIESVLKPILDNTYNAASVNYTGVI